MSYIEKRTGIARRDANTEDFGRFIPEARLKKVLKDLHPGFHFDVGGNLDLPHPQMGHRQGVWFNGQHICSMDRGNIPEAKVWICTPGLVDIPWVDIDKYEDAQICYVEIKPTDAEFEDAWKMFESKQDGYHVDHNGKLFHYRALVKDYAPNWIEMVGWQHTVYRVLRRNIPGVTKAKIAMGLGINPESLKFNDKVAFVFAEE